MEGKAPTRKRNLSLLHKQVRTPGSEVVWVGLVGSHVETEGGPGGGRLWGEAMAN